MAISMSLQEADRHTAVWGEAVS